MYYIYIFPISFFFYQTLQELNLAHNSIEILVRRQFLKLTNLKRLDLSENNITELPVDVFNDISNLLSLKCRKCQLNEIDGNVLYKLRFLTELDLGYNKVCI